MARQHTRPLLLGATAGDARALDEIPLTGEGEARIDEALLRDLIHAHPACLPISEIDAMFAQPVAICTELSTPAGFIDVFLLTPSGLPVIVETKLWRNPEGRREVVGQIIDYAKELSHWTCSDLQREAAKRLGEGGPSLVELVRRGGHDIDEIDFNDALTANLRAGRFMLLIIGDGIRQGVETIAEYVQDQPGMHFTLGLVEMPVFLLPDGRRLVAPRVVARTHLIRREVIALPDGMVVARPEQEQAGDVSGPPDARRERARIEKGDQYEAYWRDVLAGLRLDDPDQAMPKPARTTHIVFKIPAPGGSSWITMFRSLSPMSVGVFLSGNVNSVGEQAARMLAADAEAIREGLGESARVDFSGDGFPEIADRLLLSSLDSPDERARAIVWLRRRINDFVNVLRPRVRAALRDLEEQS